MIINADELQLTIHYTDNSSSEPVLVPLTYGEWTRWLDVDDQKLLEMVDNCASQVEIASTFPDRSWSAITDRYYRLRHKMSGVFGPMKDNERFADYYKRVDGKIDGPQPIHSGSKWRKNDMKQLTELLDRQATQLEIAAVFPTRRWIAIRKKITQLRGDIRISGMVMPQRECYIDFQKQQDLGPRDVSDSENRPG